MTHRWKTLTSVAAAALLLPSPASAAGLDTDPHETLFEDMLGSTPVLRGIAAEPERYRLQIVVGEVDGESRSIEWHAYRPDAEYFYPASTVKLPVAALALVELRRLAEKHGVNIDRDTPMVFHPLFAGETVEDTDPTDVEGGVLSVGHEVRKIMLASDNAAYNRLFEFVGHERANAALQNEANLASVMLTHRLSEYRTPEQNRRSPAISLLADGGRVEIPPRTSEHVYAESLMEPHSIRLGRGYLTRNGLVPEPMQFADNNRASLADLVSVVQMIVRPDLSAAAGLGLNEDDRLFLMNAMGELPAESGNPVYNEESYPDEWGKFFLPGVRTVFPGNRIRIYNKIGRAYGTSTDAAYLFDTVTERGVFLAVTIYTNDNAILNDNVYEYDSLADPAMADIGAFVVSRFLLDSEPTP